MWKGLNTWHFSLFYSHSKLLFASICKQPHTSCWVRYTPVMTFQRPPTTPPNDNCCQSHGASQKWWLILIPFLTVAHCKAAQKQGASDQWVQCHSKGYHAKWTLFVCVCKQLHLSFPESSIQSSSLGFKRCFGSILSEYKSYFTLFHHAWCYLNVQWASVTTSAHTTIYTWRFTMWLWDMSVFSFSENCIQLPKDLTLAEPMDACLMFSNFLLKYLIFGCT